MEKSEQNEEEERKMECLREEMDEIKLWIESLSQQPQFLGDSEIKAFICGCKHDIPKTKKKIFQFFKTRQELMYFIKNENQLTDDYINGLKLMRLFPLPMLNENGYRIFVGSLANEDLTYFDVRFWLQKGIAIFQMIFRDEQISNGEVVVMDVKHLSFSHVAKIGLRTLRDSLFFTQNVLPIRLKAIILINAPAAVDFLVNKISKPFMKKKLFERIFLYREDYPVLENHFSLKSFPKDFGGEERSIEELNNIWIEKILANSSWFIEENSKQILQLSEKEKNLKNENQSSREKVDFKNLSID